MKAFIIVEQKIEIHKPHGAASPAGIQLEPFVSKWCNIPKKSIPKLEI